MTLLQVQHDFVVFVGCYIMFCHNYLGLGCSNQSEIELASQLYILSRVDWGTNGLTSFMVPIAEAIFLHSLSVRECLVKFSSIYIPRDFSEETCSIGTFSMESSSV